MHRWIAILLLFWLPVDFSLAATCVMCRDTEGAVYGMASSEAAKPATPKKLSTSLTEDRRQSKEDDCTCMHCQLDIALVAWPEFAEVAMAPPSVLVPIEPRWRESGVVFLLDRPNWQRYRLNRRDVETVA